MKVSDLIAELLEEAGVRHAFGVQGGAVVHIFDSLEESLINVTYSVFEQSAALAAVAASRVSGQPQLCVVTTGPGGTNAVTGLLAAWQDSVPTIFVSGQTRASQVSYGTNQRQIGSQEAPILNIVRPICKAAVFVGSPVDVESALVSAIKLATTGRPGPVWIDIPVDVQWGEISRKSDTALQSPQQIQKKPIDSTAIESVNQLLDEASRPLLWLGAGSRSALPSVRALVDTWNLPFVCTWQTKHLLGPEHPLDLGVVGPFGQRGANLATYQADLLVALGSHFGVNQTTGNLAEFCPEATKVVVDIDEAELEGLQISVSKVIRADVTEFLQHLLDGRAPVVHDWSPNDVTLLKKQNSAEDQRHRLIEEASPRVNSNVFMADLFCDPMEPYDVVIDGGGTALYAGWQCSYGQGLRNLVGSTAISSMGTAMAEAIGVQAVSDATKTFVVVGDGSFWMSLENLPPLGQLSKPVVVVVVNNEGYLAIRHTQQEFLGGRFHGTNAAGHLSFPQIEPIARSLGFDFMRVDQQSADRAMSLARDHANGVLVLELICPEDQPLLFSQVFRSNGDGTKSALPLSTMAPLAAQVPS
ncbi:thiamine pyrophosphate-binding protein [Candidatus Nanopelagicales bacterium]|nr:thiamine pyrophosphate-binding protein [Candidatus Nanopelagicales bacterium]